MYVNISSCSLSGWSVEKEQQDEWKSQRLTLFILCFVFEIPFLTKFVCQLLTCNRTILVPCFLRPNFDSFYFCSGWYWRIVTFHEVTNTEKVLAFGDKVCLFLHRSWRPKDWAGRVDFRGVSSYVFQFVLCDVFYLDEFSGQRFDVVFDVLVLLLPGQRTPEFPRSNFQMTVKKFLWSKNFLLFPSEINFCWMNIPRKVFFF